MSYKKSNQILKGNKIKIENTSKKIIDTFQPLSPLPALSIWSSPTSNSPHLVDSANHPVPTI